MGNKTKNKVPINKWQFIHFERGWSMTSRNDWPKKKLFVGAQDDRTKQIKYNKACSMGERVTAFRGDLFKINRVLSAPPLVVWHLFHLSRDKVNEHDTTAPKMSNKFINHENRHRRDKKKNKKKRTKTNQNVCVHGRTRSRTTKNYDRK